MSKEQEGMVCDSENDSDDDCDNNDNGQNSSQIDNAISRMGDTVHGEEK